MWKRVLFKYLLLLVPVPVVVVVVSSRPTISTRAYLVLNTYGTRLQLMFLEPTKGAGSYLAGMAVAIPILNVDGRRHTNNFSKNI